MQSILDTEDSQFFGSFGLVLGCQLRFVFSLFCDFLCITTKMSNNFDLFGVRFIGKNYSAWEFQFQVFVTGKELWGHVDGSDPAPTDATKLSLWKVKDARVMS